MLNKYKILGAITISFVMAIVAFSTQFRESLKADQDRAPAQVDIPKNDFLKFVNKLPYASRMKDYLDATGIEKHGAGDKSRMLGFEEFALKLVKKNSCFGELASHFYDSINFEEVKSKLVTKAPNDNPLRNRPSLADSLTDNTPNFQPGYLWNKALKFADNNPHLAFYLLGLCTYDDQSFAYLPGARKNKKWDSIAGDVKKYCDKSVREEDLNFDLICEHKQNASEKPVKCPPQTSQVYMPKSLGAAYDIDEELKKKISSIQAPKMGMHVLPAKYYHVLASAYTNCLLLSRGVPLFISDQIQAAGINAYRSKTLCQRLIERDKDQTAKELFQFDREIILATMLKVQSEELSCSNTKEGIPISAACAVLNTRGNISDLDFKDPKNLQIAYTKIKEFADTARDDRVPVEVFEFINGPIKCIDPDVNGTFYKLLGAVVKSDKCPNHLDKAKCSSAKHMFSTWLVDFEWSRAQHQVGLQFAIKHCPQLKPNQDPLETSCEALAKFKREEDVGTAGKTQEEHRVTR